MADGRRAASPSRQHLASLRAFTYKLSSTQTSQLPRTAGCIARSLWSCKDILSSGLEQTKARNETALAVTSFKTVLSSLLQHRKVEARLAAVILIKPTIEAGGTQFLSQSNSWIKNLIGILKKPDPPMLKSLAIVSLTRIFTLTWNHSHLVRELTTPNLPVFLSACLKIISRPLCSGIEMETILSAFVTLIPRHPTIFRAQEALLRPLLEKVASSTDMTPSPDTYYNSLHRSLARRILVALHRCVSKQNESKVWEESLQAAVAASHEACDYIFRSVHEHWKPISRISRSPILSSTIDSLEFTGRDAVGLGPWKGIFEGSSRLISLLKLLQSHVEQKTIGPVSVCIGIIVDLLRRLSSVIPDSDHTSGSTQANPHFTNDERESMFSILPEIHEMAIELEKSLITVFGHSLKCLIPQFSEMTAAVFGASGSHVGVRAKVYGVVQVILAHHGMAVSEEDAKEVALILERCCRDLLATTSGFDPVPDPTRNGMKTLSSGFHLTNSPDFCARTANHHHFDQTARSLLPFGISKIRPDFLSPKLRTIMERTAVMTQHEASLLACTRTPRVRASRVQSSLLPLLARLHPEIGEVEMLLRPRLPRISAFQVVCDSDDVVNQGEHENAVVVRDESTHVPHRSAAEPLPVKVGHIQDRGEAETQAEDQTISFARHGEKSSTITSGAIEPESMPLASPQTRSKRKNFVEDKDATLIKRHRHATQGDPHDTGTHSNVAAPIPKHVESSPPADSSLVQVISQVGDSEVAALPIGLSANNQEQSEHAELGDDGSDFEMPPLIMESDTELDDEEDT